MTLNEAVAILRNGGSFVELAEAVWVVGDDPASRVQDLLWGLDYVGLISEQAAFALYRKTGRPLPSDPDQIEQNLEGWLRILRPQVSGVKGPDERTFAELLDRSRRELAALTGLLGSCEEVLEADARFFIQLGLADVVNAESLVWGPLISSRYRLSLDDSPSFSGYAQFVLWLRDLLVRQIVILHGLTRPPSDCLKTEPAYAAPGPTGRQELDSAEAHLLAVVQSSSRQSLTRVPLHKQAS